MLIIRAGQNFHALISCTVHCIPWWRHQMETFSALLAFCAGNSPVTSEFPSQKPVTRSFDVFFNLRLNKQLSKQWRRRWFETPSHSLWRHCNVWLWWQRMVYIFGDLAELHTVIRLIYMLGLHIWLISLVSQIAKFMGPTCGPPESCRPQVGPRTLLSGMSPKDWHKYSTLYK